MLTTAVAVACVYAAGCARARGHTLPTTAAGVYGATDTTVFAAVVRALIATETTPVAVDPRPLQPDPGIVEPKPAALAELPAEVVRQRGAVVRALGLREVDALASNACPGVLHPNPSPAAVQACPKDRGRVAIVGLPRPGGAFFPSGIDKRNDGAGKGYLSVRVIEVTRSPKGTSLIAYDYVMEPSPSGGWRLVKKEPVFFFD